MARHIQDLNEGELTSHEPLLHQKRSVHAAPFGFPLTTRFHRGRSIDSCHCPSRPAARYLGKIARGNPTVRAPTRYLLHPVRFPHLHLCNTSLRASSRANALKQAYERLLREQAHVPDAIQFTVGTEASDRVSLEIEMLIVQEALPLGEPLLTLLFSALIPRYNGQFQLAPETTTQQEVALADFARLPRTPDMNGLLLHPVCYDGHWSLLVVDCRNEWVCFYGIVH